MIMRAVILSTLILVIVGSETSSIESNKMEYSANHSIEIEEHIKRVENGLLPAILIKGSEAEKYNIYERMHHYKIPGVSIAIINDGKIEWAKGYGITEQGADNPVTVETIFQAASLSKPITALSVLYFAERDMIGLESSANMHLKSWKIPENEFTRKEPPTPEMLILHTAGATSFGSEGYTGEEEVPTLLQILDGSKPATNPPVRIDYEPGSKWRYSNGGYLILQQLLEDVAGIPFSEMIHEVVLKPLNMTSSTFMQPLPSGCVTLAAGGHLSGGTMVEGKWRTIPELAAGGLWSNPTDICGFIIELQESLQGHSNRILSKSMTKKMLSRRFINMGLGVVLTGRGKNLGITFSGGNPGYRCNMFAYVRKGQGAVIMTNSDDGQFIIDEIYRSISAEYKWPDHKPDKKKIAEFDKSIYETYVGIYHSKQEIRPDIDIIIEREHDYLYAAFLGQRYRLLPESETKFFNADHGWAIEFVKDEMGKVNSIRYFITIGPGTAQREIK